VHEARVATPHTVVRRPLRLLINFSSTAHSAPDSSYLITGWLNWTPAFSASHPERFTPTIYKSLIQTG
jgi:hypothetical protein